jgi:hypothetical protein
MHPAFSVPKALRTLAITSSSVVLIVVLSRFFVESNDDEMHAEQNLSSSAVIGVFEKGILRRYIPTEKRTSVRSLDESTIKQSERALRSWVRAHRQKKCNHLKMWQNPGRVQYATTSTGEDGIHQYLVEVVYGKEVFLARILETISKNNSKVTHNLHVRDTTPSPCDETKKNLLAVTAEGLRS